MVDVLQEGADWLSCMRHEYMTRTIEYWRGSEFVPLAGTPGPVKVKGVDLDVTIMVGMEDWIIRKADLILEGWPTSPKKDDRIKDTFRGVTTWFKVVPIVDLACYQEIEQGNDLRIHTKKTG